VVAGELIEFDSLRSSTFVQHLLDTQDQRVQREVIEQIEIELKYDGYIHRQEDEIEKFEKFESMIIPSEFDYKNLKAISAEGKEKLSKIRPRSIGQASRISGVTTADVSVLMVHLRK
jgi:tRNA uridine 5-carboxymethylaminomethyl modification enzyme